MTLTFQEYKDEHLGSFKRKRNESKKKLGIFIVLTYIYVIFLIYIYTNLPQEHSDLVIMGVLVYFSIAPIAFIKYLWSKKPMFKEYFIYYTYMGFIELKRFCDAGREKEILNKSKYFFKEIDALLNKSTLGQYFTADEIRNKAVFRCRFVINQYVLPKLKIDLKQKEHTEIMKITHNVVSKIYDEDFEGLISFLEPYIEECKKRKTRFQKFKKKFQNHPELIPYITVGGTTICFLIIVVVIFYLGYGLPEIAIFFTVITGFYFLYKLICLLIDKMKSK